MKYLIISDIHGNLEALQSVLLRAKSFRVDKYIILGDLVGYGASPNEVTDIVRKMTPIVAIRGNHDKVAAGLSNGLDFNYVAREAALWTRRELFPENRDYIRQLLQGPVEVDGLFEIVHGSPWDEDYYIFHHLQALAAFRRSDGWLTFFGHTHIPAIWTFGNNELRGEAIPDENYELSLEKDKRYLINPGAVGQPRDYIPKSSLAIFDSDEMKIRFFRVNYDIKSAQTKILKAGLDEFLAERLAIGS